MRSSFQAPTCAAVEAGDILLDHPFYLRAEVPKDDGVGETSFVFELGKPPYTKSVEYPVQALAEWTKVQIRFPSVEAYAPGEAHMNFHLGYDTETIDNRRRYRRELRQAHSPQPVAPTRAPLTATVKRPVRPWLPPATRPPCQARPPRAASCVSRSTPSPSSAPSARMSTASIHTRIEGFGATVRRMGGNRQTAYNWEINASNAGSDYQYSSDEWPCTAMGYGNCSTPGAQFLDFVQENRAAGMESIVTIPLVDYVSADKFGSVADNEKAPIARAWVRSYPKKPGPFSPGPPISTIGKVYQDEFVNLLVNKLGPGQT